MPAFSLSITVSFLCFFVSLLGARFGGNNHWIKFLYPLGFSGSLFLWTFLGNSFIKIAKNTKYLHLFMAITGILLFALLSKLLPPIIPLAPDPFIPTPPIPLDWHTIFVTTLPLAFLIHSLILSGGGLLKAITSNSNHGITSLLLSISLGISLHGITPLFPQLDLPYLVAIYILLTSTGAAVYLIFTPKPITSESKSTFSSPPHKHKTSSKKKKKKKKK
jgi:hypothetical protein